MADRPHKGKRHTPRLGASKLAARTAARGSQHPAAAPTGPEENQIVKERHGPLPGIVPLNAGAGPSEATPSGSFGQRPGPGAASGSRRPDEAATHPRRRILAPPRPVCRASDASRTRRGDTPGSDAPATVAAAAELTGDDSHRPCGSPPGAQRRSAGPVCRDHLSTARGWTNASVVLRSSALRPDLRHTRPVAPPTPSPALTTARRRRPTRAETLSIASSRPPTASRGGWARPPCAPSWHCPACAGAGHSGVTA